MDLIETSKYISLILRHKPETIGITLDEHGYANVNDLLNGLNINFQILEEIVKTDNKNRYSFNDDKTKIRANQGHSINVDVELIEKKPPDILYHGTATKYVSDINKYGLLPKSRLYVHLTDSIEVAKATGVRHGELVIYEINAKKMYEKDIKFYLSVNNVWLTKRVENEYIKIIRGF